MKTKETKLSAEQQFTQDLMLVVAKYQSRAMSERVKRALAEKKLRSIKIIKKKNENK